MRRPFPSRSVSPSALKGHSVKPVGGKMGLRFRRGLGLGRGLRLNISKGGVSLTAGGKGGAINIGRRGVTGTLGLPGSGISYSRRLGKGGIVSWVFVLAVAALIAWQYLGQDK